MSLQLRECFRDLQESTARLLHSHFLPSETFREWVAVGISRVKGHSQNEDLCLAWEVVTQWGQWEA